MCISTQVPLRIGTVATSDVVSRSKEPAVRKRGTRSFQRPRFKLLSCFFFGGMHRHDFFHFPVYDHPYYTSILYFSYSIIIIIVIVAIILTIVVIIILVIFIFWLLYCYSTFFFLLKF